VLIDTVQGNVSAGPAISLINVIGDTAIPGNSYINDYSAMTVPAFWSAVRFLCETVSQLDRHVHQQLPDSRVISPPHPLNTLLTRSISDVSTPNQTLETWLHHATVWGNGYVWIKRDSRNRPVALLNLNPEITTPFLHNGVKYFYINTQQPVILDDADVLHLSVIGFDGVKGYPLVQLMRFAIETNKQQEMFTREYFSKGTFTCGTIETPQPLTDAQIQTLRLGLGEYQGFGGTKKFETMILPFGAKLNNSTIPNQTSQLIETRKFSDIAICQMLRVPPHIIYQLDQSKWANVSQMGSEVIKFSLASWIGKVEEQLNLKLFSVQDQNAGYYIRLDTGYDNTLSAQLMAEVNCGIRTLNEARRLMHLPDVGPVGDQLRIPVSFPTAPQGQTQTTAPIVAQNEDDATAAPAIAPAPAGTTAEDEAQEGLPGATVRDPEAEPSSYAAILHPVITAAIERVTIKTDKAFAAREGKPATDLIRWGNVFAAEQSSHVTEVFAPIRAAAVALHGDIDVERIANRYETAIKRRAAGNEADTLETITNEVINNVR
jgi:HK97 family phage portal protein